MSSVADLDWSIIVLSVLGAAAAGFVNTLAGNGSAITLSVLTEAVGLPATLANGTNRVGTFAQSAMSTFEFWRSGRMPWRKGAILLLPVVMGALLGGYVSSQVSNAAFTQVFRWMLLFILGVVLVKPKRWLSGGTRERNWPAAVIIVVGLLVGFYGGFIQMGYGALFLALAVLGGGFSIMEANALKAAAVAIYTVPLLFNFVIEDQIDWSVGLLMSVGQGGAAYFTTRFAVRSPWASQAAYVLLVVVVVAVVARTFLWQPYYAT